MFLIVDADEARDGLFLYVVWKRLPNVPLLRSFLMQQT